MSTDSITDTSIHRGSLQSRLLGLHYRALHYVHNWGSTEVEREAKYACEGYVRGPHVHYYRAIDIDAPPPIVFRWLCQLQVAPYSYDWVDNWCKQSPLELTPGAGELKVGQGWFMKIFKLVEFEQDKEFTLRIGRGRWFFGSDVGATYVLTPRGAGSCRVCVGIVTYKKPGLLAELRRRQFPWGELLMMRKQLLNMKQLAETQARAGAAAD
jgi:hypothetical protein